MTVLIVGADASADAVAAALEAEEIGVARPPADPPRPEREGELQALAAELLAFESLLAGNPPEAVVLTDASDRALAALLAATKVPIPVGAMLPSGETDELNAGLIGRLADATLADEPRAVAWLHELMPSE